MKQLPLPTHLIVDLPPGTVAKAVTQEGGKRLVYFEATRDGVVDREGEMVAAEALWKSRDLMLSQGQSSNTSFSSTGPVNRATVLIARARTAMSICVRSGSSAASA